MYVSFVVAKTRVTPLGNMTIPRLELLSALLLATLISSVRIALETEIELNETLCFTDSKVSLYWIRGSKKEWKQFVENRVNSIRSLVDASQWFHYSGTDNPADIPSRGMSISELVNNKLWLSGPEWLSRMSLEQNTLNPNIDEATPEECSVELRRTAKKPTHNLIVSANPEGISNLIRCEDFSSLHKLLRVTKLVSRFVRLLQQRLHTEGDRVNPQPSDIDRARLLWVKQSQSKLQADPKFVAWQPQFDLFVDAAGLWRCGGRFQNSHLPTSTKSLILLDKNHHLTYLIVLDAHRRVMHNGVKETLAELRSSYWIVRGRHFIRKVIHSCVVCRRIEGRPYKGNPSPPLPEFRVSQSRPFQFVGVDFAGPLYVKPAGLVKKPKVWLLLCTCCSTCAVHLELVPDLNTLTYIRCFKRFTARHGIPSMIISDNGTTFTAASKIITNVLNDPSVQEHFAVNQVRWIFNLEQAPWWGGYFERMIKSAKRCLKKCLGRSTLSYDELLTFITETEAVLNSRPLTFVSMDDLEEPLTPSHLFCGYRVLSLPDEVVPDMEEYCPNPSKLNRRAKHLKLTLD